jgi:septal ring factor EnvC (AmiA/AmiB activator)
MMFFFSAQNVNQMYRRTRFMKEYATYQRAQGEAVKVKQQQVEEKKQEISASKQEKSNLLAKGQREQENMERKQAEQKKMVAQLQKEQHTVQDLIKKEQQQEAALNAKIEKLIAEEIAREKARIEAEKKRKAEELARKERERKERERRLAEAKAREEKAKAEALAAKTAKEKAAAKQRAQEAENERKTAERHVEEAKKEISTYANADPDQKLSGSFANNKGRLPMPITGAYQVVRSFGSNIVEGLGNVRLSSKGLHLQGQPGAKARCVFDGVVSKIYSTGNSYIVMVRHGKYISVYCDLAAVSVAAGQKVTTNQTLGSLGASNTMQFQLRNWTELLDPRPWLRR